MNGRQIVSKQWGNALILSEQWITKVSVDFSARLKIINQFKSSAIASTKPSAYLSSDNSQNIMPPNFLRRTNFAFSFID